MKTISLLLLGSILTIAFQLVDVGNMPLISNANAAGKVKTCRVIEANEDEINSLYKFGYRVKGAGGGGSKYNRLKTFVIMCNK